MMELLQSILTKETKILFIIVVAILVLEMLTGLIKGYKENALNSTKFKDGLLKKSSYFIQIILAALVSLMMSQPYLLYCDLLFISASEGISILENLVEIGVPVPDFLRNVLIKTKDSSNNGENDNKQ